MSAADRAAFEKWADGEGHATGRHPRFPEKYDDPQIQFAWRAWLAAVAAKCEATDRAAFVAWWMSLYRTDTWKITDVRADGSYFAESVQRDWVCWQAAVAAEREACEKAVLDAGGDNTDYHAAAIRARGAS